MTFYFRPRNSIYKLIKKLLEPKEAANHSGQGIDVGDESAEDVICRRFC